MSERIAAAITAHRAEANEHNGSEPSHPCSWSCAADVRRHAGAVGWTVRALEIAWDTHWCNLPVTVVDGQWRRQHECTGDCAADIAERFTSRCGEMRDARFISFQEHLDNIIAELASHGVRVPRDRLVFACEIATSRAGRARPPERLLLDAAGAAKHYDALVAAGCGIIEVEGLGWIPGRRYFVLLEHAWHAGSPRPVAASGAEYRLTVGMMPAWLFEALERHRVTRRPLRALVKRRHLRKTWEIPFRPRWADGVPASEQGCPTVPPAPG
jgi:hypothetical protein